MSEKDTVNYITLSKTINYQVLGWLMCGLGAVYYAYEYLLRITPSVMSSQLTVHFNLSQAAFGFLGAIYYYAYVPMQLPVGILMDRYGPRRLLTLACFLCVVGTYLFAGTQLFSVAATGRFLVGFGSAFAFVGVLKLATIWLPENKLGVAAGLASALGTVGGITGDNIVGGMVAQTGWQATVNYTAIFGIGLTLVLWFCLRDSKNLEEETEGTISTFKQSMIDLCIIARSKQIWINGMYGALIYLPTTVFAEFWGIPYFQYARHLTTTQAHFTNSLIFLGFAIGAPLMGLISDKIGRRKPPMICGAIVATILMLIILYYPNLQTSSLYPLAFILGLFYSVQALIFAVGRESSPNEAAGTAIAMTNMIVMAGAMFLQPIVGSILDWSKTHTAVWNYMGVNLSSGAHTMNDYYLAISIIPIGMIIAIILTFFLKETHAHAHAKSI